jgi:hypothetical protein
MALISPSLILHKSSNQPSAVSNQGCSLNFEVEISKTLLAEC